MKLHQPLFSSVIISIQTVITFFSYVSFQNWLEKLGPDSLVCAAWSGSLMFLAVIIIALFEMRSRNKTIKNIVQTLLVFLIFIQIGPGDIKNDFYTPMLNTALFCAFVVLIIFAFQFSKYLISAPKNKYLNTK